ncbi:MAG: cob(I)yrinic acid a,c-diamide adenosyltransferase [Defluviitaleaceae bacterium]|nr:cob(I)yrinic acid a,c-diamide adenosyltransferase [Defluviitaleaceae bacterium]
MSDKLGKTIVITGNGKGKTTAAIGLMTKFTDMGKKVYFGQFMKGDEYSEIIALRQEYPQITIDQYSGRLILGREADEMDIAVAQAGLERASQALFSNKYDIVVLDEINVAAFLQLIPTAAISDLIAQKPEGMTLILTGRYATEEAIATADHAYDIEEIKHYFYQGINARKGIEM